MKRNPSLNVAWLMLFACLLLSGCQKKPAPPPSSTATGFQQEVGTIIIGVSLANPDGSWRKQMQADLEAAVAKHPKIRLVIKDAKNDPSTQREHIEEFIAGQVKLIIVSPTHPQTLTEPVAKAFDAGTPVIVLDRALLGDKYSCFIAADPKQIGAEAGKFLASRLQNKGKIVELRGPVDSLFAEVVHNEFRNVLKDPGYRFVFAGCLDPPKVDAAKLMGEALQKVEQIDAVFAYDDAAAFSAYQTAKAAGREKDVAFVGVGGHPSEGADYVKKHILAATIFRSTGGAEAIDSAVKILAGQKVPKTIVLPTSSFAEADIPHPSEKSK